MISGLALLAPAPSSGGLRLVEEQCLLENAKVENLSFPALPFQFYQMEGGCSGYNIQAFLHLGTFLIPELSLEQAEVRLLL